MRRQKKIKSRTKLIEFLQLFEPEDLREGLKLYSALSDIINIDQYLNDTNTYLIDVPDYPDENTFYTVEISIAELAFTNDCDCEECQETGSCKHSVAAFIDIICIETNMTFLELEKLLPDKPMKAIEQPANSGKVISLFSEDQTPRNWQQFVSPANRVFLRALELSGYAYKNWLWMKKIKLLSHEKETPSWNFQFKDDGSKIYYPEIKYDRIETFEFRCTCADKSKMCGHVKTAFDLLEENHDSAYFLQYKDWSNEKARMLESYGLKPADDESKRIEFFIDYSGNLQMKVPSWLWGKNTDAQIANFKKSISSSKDGHSVSERPRLAREIIIDFRLGFLFNFVTVHFRTGLELETMKVFEKATGKHFKKLSIHKPDNLALLKELPDDIYALLLNVTEERIKKYLSTSGYSYLAGTSNPWNILTDNAIQLLQRYYLEQLQKLWPFLCSYGHVYQLSAGNFSNANVQPAKLSADTVSLFFSVHEDERFITISRKFMAGQIIVDPEKVHVQGGIFKIDGVLYLPANIDDLEVLNQFQYGFIKIPIANKRAVIANVIPALQKKFTVHLPPSLQLTTIEVTPKPQVLLREYNTQYLMFQPQFLYEETTVDYENNAQDILQSLPDGTWQIVLRDTAREKAFFEDLRALHHLFDKQKQNDFFYLPFEDVMKKNWFINTVHQLQDKDVPVLGMQELKKFRYNTNKPTWDMKAGSGIDWFDLSIEISFGDQVVPLKEVRKALISKQNIVLLGDGTIGVLPEEWLQQYGLILKIGNEQKDGTLRLSKLHYTLIDELHDQIDDEHVLQEIQDKKQRLQRIDDIKTVTVSRQINAELRPYQHSGFQWMQTLDELGWGGCLADDMGLGKTLQTITFLQFLKEKYTGCTHLVICPTSLIYNWENELKKFAPSLTYHIYYGSTREFSNEHFNDYDIVITSYGIIRKDLEQLLQFHWHYVILDESQAIKNPDSQTNKAVQLLKSKNRLILSGTPVQNNTYDLYAQFNFINPGLLGNREFYKDFANGIDKYNDAEKTAQLRKMVYPFMLRRTKEQVAPDLPDKTEMILWCEMTKEQRAVYDDFKNHYRTTLLKKIEEVGMAKAGIYILEGLLRLRQICDSPQLVKSSDVTTQKSVKIDELVREINENTGQHKLLVFSQFTEMLELIRQRIEQEGIRYAYLDGSTTAVNRTKAVDDFQTDPGIKVFLISLKAGGVGLNLTAADYIYLVDPWWNPAVEQQAIDRTHRIGQVNKIFAYRMICKNTIEEKIIELQQRKKQIADDLVTEDAGFIKKLKKDDIEFLFN